MTLDDSIQGFRLRVLQDIVRLTPMRQKSAACQRLGDAGEGQTRREVFGHP